LNGEKSKGRKKKSLHKGEIPDERKKKKGGNLIMPQKERKEKKGGGNPPYNNLCLGKGGKGEWPLKELWKRRETVHATLEKKKERGGRREVEGTVSFIVCGEEEGGVSPIHSQQITL